jgi:predicted secreted protein
MQEFTEGNDGAVAHCAVGDRFRIRLQENRTTGFKWATGEKLDPVLHVVGENYEPAGQQPGAGGVHTWDIECTAQGRAKLEFGMSRSWDAGSPVKRFSMTAEVR